MKRIKVKTKGMMMMIYNIIADDNVIHDDNSHLK